MTGLVLNTSAIVAIVRAEPEADALAAALGATKVRLVSAPSVVELAMVLEGRRAGAAGAGDAALRDLGVAIVPFDDDHAARAVKAWRRFGKGRHPAGLNFGDCCTYALAEERGLAILCVGGDFRRTGWPVVDGS